MRSSKNSLSDLTSIIFVKSTKVFKLNSTLLIRILVILYFVISPYKLISKNIDLNFGVYWNGVHLANLEWDSFIDLNHYDIKTKIYAVGLLSKIHPYSLSSKTKGITNNNKLFPSLFEYKTITKKKNSHINFEFNKNGLISNYLVLPKPEEIFIDRFEGLTVNKKFSDPITQLFEFFLYKTHNERMVIDGRRIFTLDAKLIEGKTIPESSTINFFGKTKGLDITFPIYKSLWKDDKHDKSNVSNIIIYYANINDTDVPVQLILKSQNFNIYLNLMDYNIII